MSDQSRPTWPNQGMPNDGSAERPAGGSPTGNAPRVPDDWPQNQSRRRFLKAALISSAAGLAAGGATYAAIESVASTAPISSYTFIGQSGSPGGQTMSACTTDTGSEPDADDTGKGKSDAADYESQSTFNNQEAIFLWAQFGNLPGGNYTLSVTPEIETSAALCGPPVTNPFVYLGNPVNLYNLGKTHPSWTCAPPDQSALSSYPAPQTASTVEGLGTISVAAGDDLLLQVHMRNGCGAASPSGGYKVTITLTGPVTLAPHTYIIIKKKP